MTIVGSPAGEEQALVHRHRQNVAGAEVTDADVAADGITPEGLVV